MPDVKISQFSTAPVFNPTDLFTGLQGGNNVNWAGSAIETMILRAGGPLALALAAKAPLDSPSFTGSPTAPTQLPGTNSSLLATTAFVHAVVASATAGVSSFNTRTGAVVPQTGDYTKTMVGLGNVDNTSDANKPISNAQAAVNATLAPLNTPAFAGTPTAPTAVPGTSTSQLATTLFVMNAVAAATAGVASFNTRTGAVVPQTGDYTKAMVGLGNVDDTSDAVKFTNTPLTGTPTAPTAAADTNTTQLATTAFVQQEIADRAIIASVKFIGTNPYTPVAADDGQILVWADPAQLIFNGVTGLRAGWQCELWQDNTGDVMFTNAGGGSFFSRGNLRKTAGQFAGVTICHLSGGQFRLAGDLVA